MSLPSPPGEARLDRQSSPEGDPYAKKPRSLNSFRDFSGETLNDATEDTSSTAKHSEASPKSSFKTFDGAWECEKHPSCVLVLQTARPLTEDLQVLQEKASKVCLLCLVEQSQSVPQVKATDPVAELDDNESALHHDDPFTALPEEKAEVLVAERHDFVVAKTKEGAVAVNGEDKEPTEFTSEFIKKFPEQPKLEEADSAGNSIEGDTPEVDDHQEHFAKDENTEAPQPVNYLEEPCKCPADGAEGEDQPIAESDIEKPRAERSKAGTGTNEPDKTGEPSTKENLGHADTSIASAAEDIHPAQTTSHTEASKLDEDKPTSDTTAPFDDTMEFLTAKSGPVPSHILEEDKHDDEEVDSNDSQPIETVQPEKDGSDNKCINAKDTSSDSVQLDDKRAEKAAAHEAEHDEESTEHAPIHTDNAHNEEPEVSQDHASIGESPLTKEDGSTMNNETSTSDPPAKTEPDSAKSPLTTDIEAKTKAEHKNEDTTIIPVPKSDKHDPNDKDDTARAQKQLAEAEANNLFVPLKDQEEGLNHVYPHLARDSEDGVVEYPDYEAGPDKTPEHEQTLEPQEPDTPAFQSDKRMMAFVEKQASEEDTPESPNATVDYEGPSQVALPDSFDMNDLKDGEKAETASNNADINMSDQEPLESPSLIPSEKLGDGFNVTPEAPKIEEQTGNSHKAEEAAQEHGREDPQTPPTQQPDFDESSLLSPPLSTPEMKKLESQINDSTATDEQVEDYHDTHEESTADIPVINDDIQDNPAEAIKLPEADTSEIAKDPAEPEDTPMPDADDITPFQDDDRAYETPPQEVPTVEEASPNSVKSPTMPGAFPFDEPTQEIELAKDSPPQAPTPIASTVGDKATEQSAPETKNQTDEKKAELDEGKIDLPSTPVKKEKKKKLGSAQRKRLARKAMAEAAAKANEEAKNA